jgi:uncharacterized linocin/CFP29 family protein
MHSDLVDLGWTEEHWNRISSAVTEEAQKGRVAAQMLPLVGPEEASTIAVPSFTLSSGTNSSAAPPQRLQVNSDPTLHLTRLAVNVQLRSSEIADPNLSAALTMFRRAANYIARLEDLLVFGGRPFPDTIFRPNLRFTPPEVWTVHGSGTVDGLMLAYSGFGSQRRYTRTKPAGGTPSGEEIIEAIVDSINQLDAGGQLGPYACALSPSLFAAICKPTGSLVLPRDRILPFLQGPLVRASALLDGFGVVVALSASPVELLVASDISVRYLQTTQEPRYVFRVSERVALRIKEHSAIGILFP